MQIKKSASSCVKLVLRFTASWQELKEYCVVLKISNTRFISSYFFHRISAPSLVLVYSASNLSVPPPQMWLNFLEAPLGAGSGRLELREDGRWGVGSGGDSFSEMCQGFNVWEGKEKAGRDGEKRGNERKKVRHWEGSGQEVTARCCRVKVCVREGVCAWARVPACVCETVLRLWQRDRRGEIHTTSSILPAPRRAAAATAASLSLSLFYRDTGGLARWDVKRLEVWHARMLFAKTKEMVTATRPAFIRTLVYFFCLTTWWVRCRKEN